MSYPQIDMFKYKESLYIQMKNYFPRIARYLLAVLLLFFGANGMFNFMTPPPFPESTLAFWGGLASTGYFLPFMGGTLFVVGVMLAINKWVPLGLVILAPLSVNILLYHLFMDIATIFMAVPVIGLNIYLGYVYFDAYRKMFV